MSKSTLQSVWEYARLRMSLEDRLKDFLAPVPYVCHFYERHYLLQSLVNASFMVRPGPMLDVGCGMKPYRSLFAKTATPHWGIDYPTTIGGSYGKSTAADVWGTSLDLPFADGSFESVLCTQVLEHVPDPAKTISEIARVLRPGGIVILTAPMTWPTHEVPHDYYRYTEFGLAALFARVGLKVTYTECRGSSITSLSGVFADLYLAPKRGQKGLLKYANQMANVWFFLATEAVNFFSTSQRLNLGWTFVGQKSE